MEKVTQKSTKQDIWDAYTKLLNEQRTQTPQQLDDTPTQTVLNNLRKATQQVDEALASALSVVEKELETQKKNNLAAKTYHAEQIAKINEQKLQLEREMQAAAENNERQQEAKRLEQKRAEEEYRYQLEKKRRAEQDAYDKTRAEKESKLKAREQELAEKEDHLAELEKLAADFPQKLEDAKKEATATTAKELEAKHKAELTSLNMNHKHEKEILSLKTAGYEKNINQLTNELNSLRVQLDSAQKQLKDMAVTVIRAQSPAADKTDIS